MQILNYEIYFSPMHSPMKNQQAISVTTTAFTATSFMEAYGRRGDFSDILYKRLYNKRAALQGKLFDLGPLESEGVLGQVANSSHHATNISRGHQLHLGRRC